VPTVYATPARLLVITQLLIASLAVSAEETSIDAAMECQDGAIERQLEAGDRAIAEDNAVQNFVLAESCYRKAAAQGSAIAQEKLGTLYFGERNFEEALQEWKAAAQQGNLKAQLNLAQAYLQGHGPRQDLAKARSWFYQAAKQLRQAPIVIAALETIDKKVKRCVRTVKYVFPLLVSSLKKDRDLKETLSRPVKQVVEEQGGREMVNASTEIHLALLEQSLVEGLPCQRRLTTMKADQEPPDTIKETAEQCQDALNMIYDEMLLDQAYMEAPC